MVERYATPMVATMLFCGPLLAACTTAAPAQSGDHVDVVPPDPEPEWVIPGIVERARFEHTTFSSHLGELAPVGDRIYVANSFDGLAAYQLGAEGQLVLTLDKPADPVPRCSTLAIHEPSASLFCGSDRSDSLAAFSIADPSIPVLRDAAALPGPQMFVRDIFVKDDTLWLARFDEGLWNARIAPDGTLSELAKTSVAGNVRFVDATSQGVVVATSDRGLLLIDTTSAVPAEIASMPLSGPPVDLAARDSRAVVALGSQGALVVSSESLAIEMEVHPPGVVVAVDIDGPWLAATTLSGTYLYEITDGVPRLAGYAQTNAVGTDAAFVAGDLIVSDFFYVDRYFLRPGGHVTQLDAPRGAYFRAGESARLPLHNPGALPLQATVRDELGRLLAEKYVPPGQTVSFEMPWNLFEGLLKPMFHDTSVRIETSYPADLASDEPSWRLNSKESIATLLVRPADADPALVGRPAPGDTFPEAWMTVDGAVSILPLKQKSRITFYSTDCIAMWAQLEDSAWLARRGLLDDGAMPVFVSHEDAPGFGFPKRFALEDMMFAQFGQYGLPEVAAQNAKFGSDLYEGGFWLGRIIAGASHPTDYLVDDAAVVLAVEREYRGAFPLR